MKWTTNDVRASDALSWSRSAGMWDRMLEKLRAEEGGMERFPVGQSLGDFATNLTDYVDELKKKAAQD